MKRICAWCKKELSENNKETPADSKQISHGICPDCVRNLMKGGAIKMREYLNLFKKPVFLVGEGGVVINANDSALAILKKTPDQIEDQLGGDVFECRYAKLPGGCGNTVHCKACVIRQTVTDTMKTGKPHTKVPAYPDLNFLTKEEQIRFLISTEKAGDTTLLQIDDVTMEKK